MGIAELGMVFAIFVMAVIGAVVVFALIQAALAAKHRRNIEWLEAQRRTGLTVKDGTE